MNLMFVYDYRLRLLRLCYYYSPIFYYFNHIKVNKIDNLYCLHLHLTIKTHAYIKKIEMTITLTL